MIERTNYLTKLKKLKDKQLIKVITGIRRCGKSTLLKQFQNYLKTEQIQDQQIISINFEDLAFETLLDYRALYTYINERLLPDRKMYIFLDEIQNVKDFQKAIDSLYIKDNTDIYITGSNAYMLSGELATLLSGRYVEIQMLPLSFKEYVTLTQKKPEEAWQTYAYQGGFPYLAYLTEEEIRQDYLNGIYHTVLMKDIVSRKQIKDIALLEKLIHFIFDNVGNIVSVKKIADTLTSNGYKTTPNTIENYITALMDSFIIYKVGRYDVKGRQHLKSLEKYYLSDLGLRSIIIPNKVRDYGHVLENIVFLELSRRGYQVSIGKLNDLEIDFIAEKNQTRIYYQVSATILDETTYEREITPLRKIRDSYPKYILTMDHIQSNEDGIQQQNMIDFLLSDTI